jgi:hypothetical protein
MTASAEALAAARAGQTRVPDFFIVGHPKSGTTALYEMLRRHPQIFMPDLKEPRFFAPELYPRRSEVHPHTLEEYVSLFEAARPGQVTGEASPLYLRSRTAAGLIAKLRQDARIIAILREPASFLRSLHLQNLENHVETERDLRKALDLEGVRRQGKAIPRDAIAPEVLMYSEHVQYVEQLRRFHAAFPPAQVLVLVYDDFRADNEGTVRQVLRFLGVDDKHPIEMVEANPTVRVRSTRLYELLRSLYLGRGGAASAVKAGIKTVTPRRLRLEALHATRHRILYGKPRPPDEELMVELQRRFKSEVVALSEFLGRDLVTLWGYDGVG